MKKPLSPKTEASEKTEYSHLMENVYYRVVKKNHIEWELIELREGEEKIICCDIRGIVLGKLGQAINND